MDDDYRIIHTREHYEAYINGEFYCSADTYNEAECEVNDNVCKDYGLDWKEIW